MTHLNLVIINTIKESINGTLLYKVIFFLIAFINILAIYFDIFWLKAITKPFITIILFFIYADSFSVIASYHNDIETEERSEFDENIKSVISKAYNSVSDGFIFIFTSLIFCFLGDIFLLFENTFLVGLLCFLMGHFCFWVLLWRNSLKKEGLIVKNKILILPFIAYLGILLYYIFPHIKNDLILQIAVVIYGTAITVSGILALNRFGFISTNTFVLVFVGFLFFIISDTWIAWQKFVLKTNHTFDNLMVMTTYIIALFLIVQGFIDQKVTEIKLILNELNLFSNTESKQGKSIIKQLEENITVIFNKHSDSKKKLTKKEREELFEQIKREFINQKNKNK
ncbi:MAG: hypothetical protein EAY69_07365 [Cytophagales bacterium]|nr:MAG: hypothetical protein EAY69_07365 [Cytophagales bacterium]